MANDDKRFESTAPDDSDLGVGAGGRSGSDVKQGMHGHTVRANARGRDEFNGKGESAALDTGRTEQAGRHYGRSGTEEPGPGYGRGSLQPDDGTVAREQNDGVDFDEARQPEMAASASRSMGDHGEKFAQGRDAGERKQMLPGDGNRGGKPGT